MIARVVASPPGVPCLGGVFEGVVVVGGVGEVGVEKWQEVALWKLLTVGHQQLVCGAWTRVCPSWLAPRHPDAGPGGCCCCCSEARRWGGWGCYSYYLHYYADCHSHMVVVNSYWSQQHVVGAGDVEISQEVWCFQYVLSNDPLFVGFSRHPSWISTTPRSCGMNIHCADMWSLGCGGEEGSRVRYEAKRDMDLINYYCLLG